MSLIPSPSRPAAVRRRTRVLILVLAAGVFVLGSVGVAVYAWGRFGEDENDGTSVFDPQKTPLPTPLKDRCEVSLSERHYNVWNLS